MTQQEVIDLMESSKSARDWNDNCHTVKDRCEGYPEFWWATIIQSGRADKIMSKWGDSSKISIQPLE